MTTDARQQAPQLLVAAAAAFGSVVLAACASFTGEAGAAEATSVSSVPTPELTPAPASGAYPPSRSSLTFEPVPSVPMPGYLAETRDPTFGGYVTRISNVAGRRNGYAKRAAWNADGSLAAFFGYGDRLLDGETFEDLGSISGVPGRPTWSNVDPDIIWGTNNGDNRLKRYRVSTGKTTYRAFAGYSEVDLGNGEGIISDDDRYIGLVAYPDGGGVHCLMYDSQLDQVLGSESIGAEPDWLSTSPSGKWIVVRYSSEGTGQTRGFWLFDQRCRRVRQITSEASHADFARSQDGTELLIHRSGSRLTARQLSADKSWDLLSGSKIPSGHVSGRAIDRWGWVYLSNHVYWSSTDTKGYDQIVAVKTDGSGAVQVFAHAHTVQSGSEYDYPASTFAVPNRDGTKVMWGGRWNDSGGIYSYVVSMEPRAR